jgi:hypothetical protein
MKEANDEQNYITSWAGCVMRDYSKISPKFWIGPTGKAIKKKGIESVVVAVYLMTSPHANMLGFYYLPDMYIAHETGMGFEGASKGLRGCIEAGFCGYDAEAEVVWVYEMAAYQIAEQLKPDDKRCIGIQNEYNDLPENKHLSGFYEKYRSAFHMNLKRDCKEVLQLNLSPYEAPSKPLRSQEQEQEQEQEQRTGARTELLAPANADAGKKNSEPKDVPNPLNLETWQSYKHAYANRYGVDPIRDAATNAKIKAIVKALGGEAPAVAEFFVSHNGGRYVAGMHQIGLLSMDYAKLRTEWATNSRMTQTKALQSDKTQTNYDAWAPLIAAAEERERMEANGN